MMSVYMIYTTHRFLVTEVHSAAQLKGNLDSNEKSSVSNDYRTE